jgi:hypothetical protein
MIDVLDIVTIFSYGSNMYSKRLIKRVPSAKILGIGKSQGFKIEFSKRSKDRLSLVKQHLLERRTNQISFGELFQLF